MSTLIYMLVVLVVLIRLPADNIVLEELYQSHVLEKECNSFLSQNVQQLQIFQCQD
jgi:hypothetical protein